jgi:2-polyprenyl-6-methoxyphenol hydroxylase-like FAD-dependent oxidoreductase
MTTRSFDVVIVGGGIAGATIAGVLARAGLGILVVEREARFRDRIRGEATPAWGVADARHAGLSDLLDAQTVKLPTASFFEHRQLVKTHDRRQDRADEVVVLGFSHPSLQEAAFTWASSQGALTLRPVKAVAFALVNGSPVVTVAQDDGVVEYTARLVIGADGKLSGVRRWVGGETQADPEHHRFGGVLVSGIAMEPLSDNFCFTPTVGVNWFAIGPEHARLYVVLSHRLRQATGIDRSFEQLVAFFSEYTPEGTMSDVHQEGPLGFFPNNCVWSSRIAGNAVVLIGDAAGAPDPTQGQGTALVYHDVRILSELLLSTRDWHGAIEAFAEQRQRYFDVLLQTDRWRSLLWDEGPDGDRWREGHERAKADDPSLGGLAQLGDHGPDGLVVDEAARRRFFGEH